MVHIIQWHSTINTVLQNNNFIIHKLIPVTTQLGLKVCEYVYLWRGGGGRGGLSSLIKRIGVPIEILKKTPMKHKIFFIHVCMA